ncbi:Rieske (2Fe-2S) protein [Nocardioides sp.]|uniref:Rieske (2Fe-2S) protein n=1 Tax=Nocardioides sp. TaxID=35761 RepID=UPI002BDD15B3|nr:Rieske (2Fe-2S) protein [Nocardioides sp.]HSX68817.1 Rieske (2Fe-2S) protein [Nocardioides sp.]
MSQDAQYSRRIVFSGLGALGVAAALAGCGSGGAGSSAPSDSSGPATSSAGTAGEVLVPTSEVPVGGGVVLTDKQLVVTQPTAGEFKAFTSKCTHQGFDVGKVEDGTITCLRHGSTFDAATGEVAGGPAAAPLAEAPIKVEGANVVAA